MEYQQAAPVSGGWKGIAGTALGLGIFGALGALGGGLGSLGGGCNRAAYNNVGDCCEGNQPVTRFELEQVQLLAAKDARIATLESDTRTDGKILALYNQVALVDKNLGTAIAQIAGAQAVTNQQVSDNLRFLDQKIDCENAKIRSWVSATYVPGKLIMPLDNICPKPAVEEAAAA